MPGMYENNTNVEKNWREAAAGKNDRLPAISDRAAATSDRFACLAADAGEKKTDRFAALKDDRYDSNNKGKGKGKGFGGNKGFNSNKGFGKSERSWSSDNGNRSFSNNNKGGERSYGFGGNKGYGKGESNGYGGGYGGDYRSGGGNLGGNLNMNRGYENQSEVLQKCFYEEHPLVSAMSEHDVQSYLNDQAITVTCPNGAKAPRPITEFAHVTFPESIMRSVQAAGFANPSAIQSQAWPIAMSGNDLIGIAETGSGKTLGFLLPAIVHINAQRPICRGEGPIALVLAPTRELAMQIEAECMKFVKNSKIRTVCTYGGVPKNQQIRDLHHGREICIATPGRLIDLIDGGCCNLDRCSYLCLDEADRMLDMGFEDQVRKICSQIRPDRQTLLFSATWPRSVQSLARDLCGQSPVQINIGSENLSANKSIKQYVEVLSETGYMLDQKKQELLDTALASLQNERIMIFTQTKKAAEQLCYSIQRKFNAEWLTGERKQEERDWVLRQFRDGRVSVLVATDVAARGLDIKGVTAVINYDMPSNIEDYVHRIGRTGRAGTTGEAFSMFSASENGKMARDLIDIMKDAGQMVPPELYALRNSTSSGKGKGKGRGGFGGGKGGGKGFGGGKGGYGGGNGGYGGSYGGAPRINNTASSW
jgi:ATP-dependent RNA helicase DDX5/DBP2